MAGRYLLDVASDFTLVLRKAVVIHVLIRGAVLVAFVHINISIGCIVM